MQTRLTRTTPLEQQGTEALCIRKEVLHFVEEEFRACPEFRARPGQPAVEAQHYITVATDALRGAFSHKSKGHRTKRGALDQSSASSGFCVTRPSLGATPS